MLIRICLFLLYLSLDIWLFSARRWEREKGIKFPQFFISSIMNAMKKRREKNAEQKLIYLTRRSCWDVIPPLRLLRFQRINLILVRFSFLHKLISICRQLADKKAQNALQRGSCRRSAVLMTPNGIRFAANQVGVAQQWRDVHCCVCILPIGIKRNKHNLCF